MSQRQPYPTDLTDEQWALVEPLLPKATRGRKPVHSRREMLNALLYLTRTGCQWRMLPHDLPPWEAVYAFWRRLVAQGVLERLNDALRVQVRLHEEREAEPSVVIVDSQSVQTAEKGGLWDRWAQAPQRQQTPTGGRHSGLGAACAGSSRQRAGHPRRPALARPLALFVSGAAGAAGL